MNNFARKHPVLFELLLVVVAMLAAAVASITLGGSRATPEVGAALGRIVVGLLMLLVFRSYFKDGHPLSGFVYALPIVAIAVWNIVYHLVSGMEVSIDVVGMLLLGFAPALFEEVLFRGVFIHNLRKRGMAPLAALVVSATFFGAFHLTNLVGMTPANVVVQVLYATVFGLLAGAVYIKTDDLASVIAAHALVDMSNHLFLASPASTSTPLAIAFALLLAVETAYALWLCRTCSDASVSYD